MSNRKRIYGKQILSRDDAESEQRQLEKKTKKKPGKKLSKTKRATLLREALRQGFEEKLREDFLDVVDAVVTAAKGGNMKAAQMILDRVVPTISHESPTDKKGIQSVNIVIGSVNGYDNQQPKELSISPADVIDVTDE